MSKSENGENYYLYDQTIKKNDWFNVNSIIIEWKKKNNNPNSELPVYNIIFFGTFHFYHFYFNYTYYICKSSCRDKLLVPNIYFFFKSEFFFI